MTDLIDSIVTDLFEHFADLDDSDDAPFGEYANVTQLNNRLVVAHQDDPSIQVEILVRAVNA